jgi:hypothetical protein
VTATTLESLRASSFERIALRRNPFGELPREERATLACVETDGPAAFLRGANGTERRALQIVADHGRGKSTLMIALHAREFPEAPFTQLHLSDPVPSPEPKAPIHFVDSIENLSWLGRRKLYSQVPTLACTTHRDLGRELRRAGYGVQTLRVGIQSASALQPMVQARVDAARFGDGSPPTPSHVRLEELYCIHGDDVRSIEQALYSDYEDLRSEAASLLHPIHG